MVKLTDAIDESVAEIAKEDPAVLIYLLAPANSLYWENYYAF